ncbi:MAG: sigma-70 family RNA polymerase sigma factor [Ahniella sp.]|nr:sigma-70 family RNA polymerase sigma factor [Ahniella sp.]
MNQPATNLRQTLETLTAQFDSFAQSGLPIRDLFTKLHHELRHIARRHRGSLNADSTLNTTGLVHEAYLKLSSATLGDIQDRAHFFSLAAQTMRQIIIDRARRSLASKRGEGAAHVPLDDLVLAATDQSASEQAMAIHQALGLLEQHSPRLAETVTMRFFGGMTEDEIGDALDRDPATVRRDWAKARAWLHRALSDPSGEPP